MVLGSAVLSYSGIATPTPGPTRAQALIKFVCPLVKFLNKARHKHDFGYYYNTNSSKFMAVFPLFKLSVQVPQYLHNSRYTTAKL